jgi:hypothetical protein
MSCFRDPFYLMVMAAFLLSALLWGLLLPIHEAPDEQNHYLYALFMKDHGRMPRQLPLPAEVPGEGHQAPLYYVWAGLMLKIFMPQASYFGLDANPQLSFGRDARYFLHPQESQPLKFPDYAMAPHLLRALQIWMPVLSLSAIWYFLASVFGRGGASKFAFVLLALNPGFDFLCGALNNDHGLILFSSLALAFMGTKIEAAEGWRDRDSLFLGTLFGLGTLCKLSILGFLPAGIFCVGSLAGRSKTRSILLLLGTFFVWSFAFFWRNWLLYGDIFAFNVVAITCPQCVASKDLFNLRWCLYFFWLSFESFWGIFGWFLWRAPMSFILSMLAVTGFAMLRGMGSLCKAPPSRLRIWAWIAALGFFFAELEHQLHFGPPAGRFFYPALLLLAAFFAEGFQNLDPKWMGRLSWITGGALFAFNLWLLFFRLIPLYYNV